MKLREAINEADTLKPNMYGMQEKIKWLSRLDRRIFEQILLTHMLSDDEKSRFLPDDTEETETDDSLAVWALDLRRRYPQLKNEILVFPGYDEEDIDEELIVGEPYDELYPLWISAQVDWHNMEYDSFNNSNAMFEAVFSQFRNAFNRSHRPLGAENIYF